MIENKHLMFYKGRVIVNKINCMLIPINPFVILLNELNKNSFYDNYVKKTSEEYAISIGYDILKNNLPLEMKLKFFLDRISIFGYGKFKLVKFSKNEIIIEIASSVFLNKFCNVNEKELELDKFYLTYVISNYIKILVSNFVLCKYDKIKSKYFLYYKINPNLKNLISCDCNEKLDNLGKIEKNSLLKRIIINRQLKFNEGNSILWGVNIIFFPLNLFDCISEIENKHCEVFFKEIGIIQGKVAVELLQKVFGNSLKKILLNNLIDQAELAGVGKILDKKIDLKNFRLYLKTQTKLNENSLIRNYIVGIYIGAMSYMFKKNFSGSFLGSEFFIYPSNEKIEFTINNNIIEKLKLNNVVMPS